MTPSDSNADFTSSKYNVQINEGKGIVIGDHTHIKQYFYSVPSEPQVDLGAAEEDYRQQVIKCYNRLNFSGLESSDFDSSDLSLGDVPLEHVFVRLTLTIERKIREPLPSKELGKSERQKDKQRERVITVQETLELDKALGNNLLVVGEPGAGKSTLLRWLAVTFAQGRQCESTRLGLSADTDRLPLLIELGHLPDEYLQSDSRETPNWFEFLPKHITKQQPFRNTPTQLLVQALNDGRCLLLFDGLDEIADSKARVRLVKSLAELASLSPANRFIIGSRPAGVGESKGALFSLFQSTQIARFTSEDIRRFFLFWYALDRAHSLEEQSTAAEALYARVLATPSTLELATTPLLCTLLLFIWHTKGALPERRIELYEQCCRVLIESWEAHHDVANTEKLAKLGWERHIRILAPLAYYIHSQERRTSSSQSELIPWLAQCLQREGLSTNKIEAPIEAEQFLKTLGLRSGLLQYLGNDRYGFSHQTFQEYLAARYIAMQPDPEYIDLVMQHLHEAWWQEVHLLTIGHLGSGNAESNRASALILTILHVYRPPNWILRSSKNRWARLIRPGKFLPQFQLDQRIAWLLAREFELASRGYAECAPDGIKATVNAALLAQAESLIRRIFNDRARYVVQNDILTVTFRLLLRQTDEAAVNFLVQLLHDNDYLVRWQTAEILGREGAGNEAAVNALVLTLHDNDYLVRRQAAASLVQLGAGNEAVNTLVLALHGNGGDVRRQAAEILGQVGVGNEAAVNALVQALQDHDRDVRRQAAASLGQLRAGNKAAVNALVLALRDNDYTVRKQAAAGLGQVGAGNEAAVNALVLALRDNDYSVRWHAAEILGQVGAGNEVAVNALVQALQDHDYLVREQAAASLVQLRAGNEAANTQGQVLQDHDGDVRRQAAASLGQVGAGNEAAVNAMIQALQDHDYLVRWQAAASLGQVGAGNEAAVNALIQALQDHDGDVRRQAAASLVQLRAGNEATVNALVQMLHDVNGSVRRQAAQNLGRMEIKDMVNLCKTLISLNYCLYDWDNEVREAALASIRQLLEGRPFPGYHWVPLLKREAHRRRIKRFAFWLGMAALIVVIGLAATWLLGVLDSIGLVARFLAIFAGIVGFIAAVLQILGRTLRDPWEKT